MSNSFNFGYALGMSLVPALLAAAALYWRIGKLAPRPASERITGGLASAVATTVVVFVVAIAVLSPDAEEDTNRLQQPLMILAGIVGFLVGRAVVTKSKKPDSGSTN